MSNPNDGGPAIAAFKALPPTKDYVDRIIRIFRDHPADDASAVVLQDYARAALQFHEAVMADPKDAGLGAALDAIDFALTIDDHFDLRIFLDEWREGRLDRNEWSDYFAWLTAREQGGGS